MSDKVGYKNPPKHTQFGQPGGNPTGKTSAQRKAEIEAGEKAAKIEAAMLDALLAYVGEDAEAALASIKADPLKLVQAAIDRANGKPTQTIDNTSSDGTMSPKPAIDASKLSDDAMSEILNARTDKD